MLQIKFYLTIAALIIYSSASAHNLKGIIQNSKNEVLPDITVILYRASDTAMVKFAVTSSNGEFELLDIIEGSYFLTTAPTVYLKYVSPIFELKMDLILDKISLKEDAKKLKEVEIVSRNPIIENKPGKLVVNVDALVSSAGKTAFEVLEQSPNITISQSNVIRMRGKPGVIIMIDGKITPMRGDDLANFLKSLPAQAIEKIEIITNASSKYDAAGNAGIINIIMKKDKRMGTNATVSITAGQGRYHKTNDGISLNNRNKKTNIYASYNYGNRKGFNDLSLYRKFYNADTLQGVYEQMNRLVFPVNTHMVRTGIDYYLSPKTILGFSLNGSLTKFAPVGDNTTKVLNSFEQLVSHFATSTRSRESWGSYSSNLNFKHTIDSLGREISADIDFARYNNTNDQHFTTNYLGLDGQKIKDTYLLMGDVNGNLQIISGKVDYSHLINKDTKWEAGAKSSYVTTNNNLKFYDESSGTSIFDSSRSNHFIYSENINAAYVNFTKTIGVYNFQFGLRGEQTIAKGHQVINGKKFNNNYLQLFPNIAIEKQFNAKYSAGISLSRRIDRPSYEQLNPFRFFLDPTTYKEGNPYLLPQLSYNAELTQTFNQRISVTLGYSVTNRLITEVLAPAENANNITVQTNVNLTRYDYYGMSISAPLQPTPWWSTVNNANIYYGYYRGNLANTNLSNGSPAFDLNSINNFSLKKNWSAELNLFYTSGQVYAFIQSRRSWQLSIGLQKTFHERRGTVKLSFNDLFWSGISAGESKFKAYNEVFFVQRDSRAAFVTLTYKLGKTTVAPSRRRNGGAEDEKRRASKSGG